MTPARAPRLVPLERPVPAEQPQYDHQRGHAPVRGGFELYGLLDTLFIVAGLVLSVWLAGLYLLEGFSLTPVRMLYLVGFWLLLTYIALPRLHQVMTWIYLPDYFIGRTRTVEGVLSDPINLAFDGDETDLHVAMRRAGWVLAEERTVGSAWDMVRATLLRRSYPEAPVSDLFLMGRRHDFTYQQEVGGTTAKRHHVRFWKMPRRFSLPGGYKADWLAAGTYDRAVGFSFFTLQFTHRIDENIDVERDYVIDTVRYADPAVEVEVIREFSTSYHHRNGQGDRIRTDGDLPIIDVAGAAERSDGATAMMLERHRPTGSSVWRARALSTAQRALSLGAGTRDAVDARDAHDGARNGHSGTGNGNDSAGDGHSGAGDGRGGADARGGHEKQPAPRPDLAGVWHETVDDLHDTIASAADHHLPPPTVGFTAALVLLQAALVGAQWVAQAFGVDLVEMFADAALVFPEPEDLVWRTVFVVLLALLVIGVFRRSRWARVGLMALFTADAVLRLLLASTAGADATHALLVGAGASALGVMAITSDAARLWVQTPRLPSRSGRRASAKS